VPRQVYPAALPLLQSLQINQEIFARKRSSTMAGTNPVNGAPSCAISRTNFELK